MTNAKLAVDLDRLADLLRRVGRENLMPILATNLRGGIFVRQEYRDEWVCLLAADHSVSSQEIADCFRDDRGKTLTRARVGQIVQENQGELIRKASLLQQARWRLEEIDSDEGRRRAEAVMRAAAADPVYWIVRRDGDWKRLNRDRVLTDLDFPPIKDSGLKSAIWRELREGKIITEDTRVGVSLRYGLGIDKPITYVWGLYYSEGDLTIDGVLEIINGALQQKDLLTVSRSSLVYYMRTRWPATSFKSRGHR